MDNYKKLIDKLASKELSFGCRVEYCIEDEEHGWYSANEGISPIISTSPMKVILRLLDGTRIDKDSDKWGTIIKTTKKKSYYKILGYPILIGDVLSKMNKQGLILPTEQECADKVVRLWLPFDFKTSLQEILSENVENIRECECGRIYNPTAEHANKCKEHHYRTIKQLKPEAKELFEFLIKYLKKEFGCDGEMCKKPYDKDCAGCHAAYIAELLEYILKKDYE